MTSKYISAIRFSCLPLLIAAVTGCKKFISVPEPTGSVTTTEQFSTDALANTALAGIYSQMISSGMGSGTYTWFPGMSADDLIDFAGSGDAPGYAFNTNNLLSNNNSVSALWSPAYSNIYAANAAIPAMAASKGMSDSAKRELTGESKFVRAFCYFYLTNLFDSVPLVLSIDWAQTSLMARSSRSAVYQQIVSDLKDASSLLPTTFVIGKGERIRPTKWAAQALLARTYLYMSDWPNAILMADSVIGAGGLFSLTPDLTSAFNKNSTEAIWQLQQNATNYVSYNGTGDGLAFIPSAYAAMTYYLSPQQISAFETGDQRATTWVRSYVYAGDGKTYYYPYKYILGPSDIAFGGDIPQYYMMLRLAELFLIRAEARAQQGTDLSGAAADINTIRSRAGLLPTSATTQSGLLTAVAHERQVELFAEWGHRWLDLKRTGLALPVLSAIPLHAAINSSQLLYPIPVQETINDPHLGQNPGY